MHLSHAVSGPFPWELGRRFPGDAETESENFLSEKPSPLFETLTQASNPQNLVGKDTLD